MLSTNVVPANPARPNGPGSAGVHPARRPPVGSVVGAGATSASRAPGIRLASICSASLLVGRTGRSVSARPGRGQWRIAERRWCAPERSSGADERQPVGGFALLTPLALALGGGAPRTSGRRRPGGLTAARHSGRLRGGWRPGRWFCALPAVGRARSLLAQLLRGRPALDPSRLPGRWHPARPAAGEQ